METCSLEISITGKFARSGSIGLDVELELDVTMDVDVDVGLDVQLMTITTILSNNRRRTLFVIKYKDLQWPSVNI